MLPIRIIGNDLELVPEMFRDVWPLRKFVGLDAMCLYVELRVRGFDTLSSFITAFGSAILGRPDELVAAAEAFEESAWYQHRLEDTLENTEQAALLAEWSRRSEEAAAFTKAIAQNLRVEPQDPVGGFIREKDTQAYTAAIAVQRSREHAKSMERATADAARSDPIDPTSPEYMRLHSPGSVYLFNE